MPILKQINTPLSLNHSPRCETGAETRLVVPFAAKAWWEYAEGGSLHTTPVPPFFLHPRVGWWGSHAMSLLAWGVFMAKGPRELLLPLPLQYRPGSLVTVQGLRILASPPLVSQPLFPDCEWFCDITTGLSVVQAFSAGFESWPQVRAARRLVHQPQVSSTEPG